MHWVFLPHWPCDYTSWIITNLSSTVWFLSSLSPVTRSQRMLAFPWVCLYWQFLLFKSGKEDFCSIQFNFAWFGIFSDCLSLSILVSRCENHQLCHCLHTIHHSRSHCYLVNLPFPSCCFLLLQITPETNLHPHHPVCTLLFSSHVHCPLLCMVEPKYFSSSSLSLLHVCSPFHLLFLGMSCCLLIISLLLNLAFKKICQCNF